MESTTEEIMEMTEQPRYLGRIARVINSPTLGAIAKRTPGTAPHVTQEMQESAIDELVARALGKSVWHPVVDEEEDRGDRFHAEWDQYKAADQAEEDRNTPRFEV